MKKLIFTMLIAAFALGGCSKNDKLTTESNEVGEANTENNQSAESSDSTADPSDGFTYFFNSYTKTELAESLTKDMNVNMSLSGDQFDPYDIITTSNTQCVNNNNDYSAHFTTSDLVDGEEIKSESYYGNGYAYFTSEGKKYKQSISWDNAKSSIQGSAFKLVAYTVKDATVTDNSDGSKTVALTFDLGKLIEAPDEQIFNLLQMSDVSYQQLRFNDATFVGTVSPEGYVIDYIMYYNGYIITPNGNLNFDYTTTVTYSDINNTKVTLPDDRDTYEELAPVEDEGTNIMGNIFQ